MGQAQGDGSNGCSVTHDAVAAFDAAGRVSNRWQRSAWESTRVAPSQCGAIAAASYRARSGRHILVGLFTLLICTRPGRE